MGRSAGVCRGPGPSGDPAAPSDSLRVQENEDNCAVIQSARDALKLIQNKFLPAACAWVRVRLRVWVRGRPRAWGRHACGSAGEGAQPAG